MEWKEVRLGDIVSIKSGLAYKGAFIGKGENILLGMGCVSFKDKFLFSGARPYEADCEDKYCVEPGDIVLATRQQSDNLPILAMPAIIPASLKAKKIIYGTNLYKVENHSEVTNDFLFWQLKTPDYIDYISSVKTGSVVRMVTKKNVEDYVFRCPPKEVRDRISKLLWGLDRKIELNNKINADLEEMAQAIFKNWFVDFEPFKDGKFVDSELGMIPEGWKVISLNEILDNVSGYSYKGSELQSSNIAMATIKNFERKGGFKTEGYKEIVISKKIKETQFVNMFDVLVAHTDLTQNAEIVGNPAIVLSKGGYEKLIMSMDLTKVISKIDGVTNGLLYCILSTSRFKEHALGYVNGTTVLHMSKKAVPEYTCAFPKDINQIRDLCITLDSIYKRMAVTYEENSHLSLLRDTLLPRLMSGELEVPE